MNPLHHAADVAPVEDVGPHLIAVENSRAERQRMIPRTRRLAGTWQTHNQDFFVQ
jgi:hypothetical protein